MHSCNRNRARDISLDMKSHLHIADLPLVLVVADWILTHYSTNHFSGMFLNQSHRFSNGNNLIIRFV